MHEHPIPPRPQPGAPAAPSSPTDAGLVLAAVGAGLCLLAWGSRRSAGRRWLAVAGGAMLLLAAAAPPLRSATRARLDERRRRHADEGVEEASEDSFPASDPPGWTSTGAVID